MSILIDILKKTRTRTSEERSSIPPVLDRVCMKEKRRTHGRLLFISLAGLLFVLAGLVLVYILNQKRSSTKTLEAIRKTPVREIETEKSPLPQPLKTVNNEEQKKQSVEMMHSEKKQPERTATPVNTPMAEKKLPSPPGVNNLSKTEPPVKTEPSGKEAQVSAIPRKVAGAVVRKREDRPEAIATTASGDSTVKYLYNKAVYLENKGRYDEALGVYLAILNRGIRDARLYNSIGYLLIGQGRYQEAGLYVKKALEMKRGYLPALINMGIIKTKIGDYPEAENYFRMALEKEPDNPEALYNMGLLYEKKGAYDQAERYYERLTSMASPLRFDGLLSLARIKEKAGLYNEARDIYRTISSAGNAPEGYKDFAKARILTINSHAINQ